MAQRHTVSRELSGRQVHLRNRRRVIDPIDPGRTHRQGGWRDVGCVGSFCSI